MFFGCFCCSHPCFRNEICTITISYKLSSNTLVQTPWRSTMYDPFPWSMYDPFLMYDRHPLRYDPFPMRTTDFHFRILSQIPLHSYPAFRHVGCFPLCQTAWPVRDQREYLRKMERHFPVKSGQPIVVVILNFVTEFPNKEYSDRNMWTTSRGDPGYSGQKKPKRIFPFEFWPKFPESLA